MDFYRKRAMKRLAIAAAVLVVAGAGVWYASRAGYLEKIAAFEASFERVAANQISASFSAPAPLVATGTPAGHGGAGGATTAQKDALTRSGVIADTNAQRAMPAHGGLPALAENETLDSIAKIRLDDMFAKQYFAHVSPASSSAITVAQSVGYRYIALGENLALGNFDGDQGVVTAWMNSPGHRENILDTHYTQIGVAVGEGNFEGDHVWIAVQIFGRPLSDCPAPNENLQTTIDADQARVAQQEADLQAERAQLDAMEPKSRDAYRQAADHYNAGVDQYNALVAQTKDEIARYNAEVNAYNTCIGQ